MSLSPALQEPMMGEVMPPEMTEDVRSGLMDLFLSVMKEEQPARRSEVRKAWNQRAHRKGMHHMWYDERSYRYMLPSASGLELPRYQGVYNIYTPHWRSFVSLLSQNPPGVNFPPDDLQNSKDVTAAAYAEKMRHKVDKTVHMKDRQTEAASYFCTDGRTVAWIRHTQTLEVTIHGVLESKVPIYARSIKGWSYCVLSEEVDLYEEKELFPDFADEMEPSTSETAEDSYERYARMNIIGGGRSTYESKSITTRHNAWFRPSRYRKAGNDETKAYLKATCPNGVRITISGGVVVDAVPDSIDAALCVAWPAPDQGQDKASMLADLIPIQGDFNDYKNNQREAADYINPATWVDGNAVDSEAIPEQRAEPGAIHIMTPPSGKGIGDCVFQETALSMSPELTAACEALLTLAEVTTGDYASLQGAGDPHSETASGQKMLTDQAKGQLSLAWGAMQWLFAGIYERAIMQLAQATAGQTVSVPGGNGQEAFDPAVILDGLWGCYPDTDSSFPETMADKRASLQMVLTQLGPADPSIVLHPDNLKLIKQFSGLADLVIPGAEARDKQLREIEQLLREPPVPDETQMPQWQQASQQAMMQGQQPPPPPMASSVPIDADWDYHQPELDKVQEWLSSDARLEEERKGNLQGIANVKLHGAAHRSALAAQAPKPQTKPPNVSMTAQITDPSAIAQLLGEVGAQVTPDEIENSQVPGLQEQAASTQHKAAQAQHQSVLAAKEAVEPVKTNSFPQPPKAGAPK